ncbi:MAG: hypothetical protein RL136_506 [Planctomycetota bacterium]|jgi:hypothetical protein
MILAACLAAGCDTISSDLNQFTQSIIPPSPAQAAAWAADPNDRENARRGTILLATAPWGGTEVYLRMYRLYATDAPDPLVRAAAIQALGRHGATEDASLVARNLESPYRQVRLAAAKALQRLHDPAVADTIWTRLVNVDEDSDIRTELAISLGQYPTPAVFNALVAALSQRELAVNLAALDSLRTITGKDYGIEEDAWLRHMVTAKPPLLESPPYLYPTFVRELDIWDDIAFWDPVSFEQPGVPAGMRAMGMNDAGARRTGDMRGDTGAASGSPEPTGAPEKREAEGAPRTP